jgi:hypothetical protein
MAQEVKYNKTILCLANSRKMSGRCIAGKELANNKFADWVRPVSGREHEEISESDRRYKDGHTAALFDIFAIPMLKSAARGHQVENHLIADQYYWTKKDRASWAQVEKAIDSVTGALWANGYSSSNGVNDRVPEDKAAKLNGSLVLIRPEKLRIRVAPKGDPNAPNKRGVRTEFVFNKEQYNIGLTDAKMERVYLQGKDGAFEVKKALLCVSLGEVFKGYAYKLAAALISEDRLAEKDG